MNDTRIAEQSVLGGMMLSKRAVSDCSELIDPTDFDDWRHELIARSVFALYAEGKPCDVLAVTDELHRREELSKVDLAYLHELTSIVPTAANAGYYAQIVRDAAVRRRLVEAAARISQTAQGEGDTDAMIELARGEVDAAASKQRIETAPVADSIEDVVTLMREPPRYERTPWKALNDLIDGLRPGTLNVIGARPGSGKTIMGLQLAAKLAQQGGVAFSSLEMSRVDLTKRLFAMMGTIHQTAIQRSALSPADWQTIEALRPRISAMPLFIDDKPGVNVTHVRAHARSVARRVPLKLVVVDYMQLMEGDRRRPRWEVVGEFSRALKLLARELEVPVVALAQLNRESGMGGLPSMSDLRESGNIEQDADTIVLLQREKEIDDSGQERDSDVLDVVVAKNRHGGVGTLKLLWEGQFARLSDLPW